jgi:hypothetical protein
LEEKRKAPSYLDVGMFHTPENMWNLVPGFFLTIPYEVKLRRSLGLVLICMVVKREGKVKNNFGKDFKNCIGMRSLATVLLIFQTEH